MGFSEESFYKSEYKKVWAILIARRDYMKGAPISVDNEKKALEKLDSLLG